MTHYAYQPRRGVPRTLFSVLLLLPLSACQREQRPAEATLEPALPPRPETVQDTVMIEGMPEVTTSRLLHLAEFEPPFSTYVPQGIDARVEAAADTGSVRFAAAFTGDVDPNAYMHVRLYPYGAGLGNVQEVVQGFLRSRAPQDDPIGGLDVQEVPPPVSPPHWAVDAYDFTYAGDANVLYVVRAVIAQHGNRFVHVISHYPAEYGDGLAPRFDYILEHWRWEDTGTMLRAQ